MKTIHSSDDYDISIRAGCSTAADLPEGTKECACRQRRIQKTPEQQQSVLARRGSPSLCGGFPTNIIITLKNTIQSEEWRKENKETIRSIIRKALDEMKIGKGHEMHYETTDIRFEKEKIGIQILRSFKKEKEGNPGNTTPEK